MRFQLFFFSNGDVLRVSPESRFRYDFFTNIRGNRLNSAGIAQEFDTISKIALEHAVRKLRNQLQIS